jgi:hypothetical protein
MTPGSGRRENNCLHDPLPDPHQLGNQPLCEEAGERMTEAPRHRLTTSIEAFRRSVGEIDALLDELD